MTITDTVAAVDIGGTKTAAALVDADGTILDRDTTTTPGDAGAPHVLDRATRLVGALRARNPGRTLAAVGVGTAGVVDPVRGVVVGATDVLKGWVGADLNAAFGGALGVPVAVRNDVHAHALGEAWRGAAAGRQSVLYVAVGTGIGAAFVHSGLTGRLLTGSHAAAGHAGHLPSPHASDLACTCGGRGHLEAIAAGPALVREYQRRTGRQAADLQEVAHRATSGDAEAWEVLKLGGAAVGSAVGGMMNILDPEIVVIGGGVTALGPLWWEPLLRSATTTALPILRDTRIVRSSIADHAALLGAASLAWALLDGGGR